MKEIIECLNQEIETSDVHYMERLEELRRTLKIILRPGLLSSLLELSKALDRGPEQYHYFLEHSIHGTDCRYAQATLDKFKRERLDKVKELLKECLEKIE